mmetsp:Transcript_40857/g.102110  ORF Transcript_40857/g.102110 Transcript_40857/m.102110 type:complete len:99 (+) Transcript_40857:368-664(+)
MQPDPPNDGRTDKHCWPPSRWRPAVLSSAGSVLHLLKTPEQTDGPSASLMGCHGGEGPCKRVWRVRGRREKARRPASVLMLLLAWPAGGISIHTDAPV